MVTNTKNDVLEGLDRAGPRLAALGIRRLGLFGSFARGQAHAESDVDLLIEFHPGRKGFDALMSAGELLESELGRRVELVTPESLSPHFGARIVAEAEYVDISA